MADAARSSDTNTSEMDRGPSSTSTACLFGDEGAGSICVLDKEGFGEWVAAR